MKHLPFVLVLGLFVATSFACKQEAAAPAEPAAPVEPAKPAEPAQPESAPAEAAAAPAAGDLIAVTKEGAKIDPPVEKAKIPEGAWICDMGTVHYARGEKGDGKCPICKMDLKQHTLAAAAAPAKEGEHDHDHEHGHEGHQH